MKITSAARQKIRSVEMQAVVIRADGTREDRGTVAYWHSNPFKRLWFAVKQHFNSPRYAFLRKDGS